MFVYGTACPCVFTDALTLCPVHKTSLVTYNKKKCANPGCKVGACGFCEACTARIVAIVKRSAPLTKKNLFRLVASLNAFLPQSAVNKYEHPYTIFVFTCVLKIVEKSPVFTVGENIELTTTVIENKLDAMPLDFIGSTETCPKRWTEFLRDTQKYIVVKKTARRKTKYDCYNVERLVHVLQNASYEGIPLNDLFKEHPDMNKMLKHVPHFNANRRIYYHKTLGSKRHHFTT
jgi:hypothetical protein